MEIQRNSRLLNNLHQSSVLHSWLNENTQRMILLFLLFLGGVCDAETDETMPVMEGDSVILRTNLSEILNDDTILWAFGPKESVISQITRKNDFTSLFVTDDVRFAGRLQVDQKTGSLTIRNTRNKHSGQYKLTISREKTTSRIFHVDVFGVVGKTDGVKSVSVIEGESVILQNDATELLKDDLIVWRFGDEGILLAKIDVETNKRSLNDADERFRNRLQLDQTGSLTITNTRTEHTGLYEVQIIGRESSQQFLVSVSADLGRSPTVIVGIVVSVLLVAGLLAAVVIYYRRKISELQKQEVEEEVSETEGRTVVLKTDTELQKGDKIKWWFEDDNKPITQISGWTNTNTDIECNATDERFRSKLKMGGKTGNLIISLIRTIHSGVYKVQISGKTRRTKRFIVTVSEEVSGTEGRTVVLKTDTELQNGDEIKWWFEDGNKLITQISEWTIKSTDIECNATDERFRSKLQMGGKTGDLIISYIRTIHSGVYKVQISGKTRRTKYKRFIVTVSVEKVPVKVGESVTLKTDIEIQEGDLILWTFGVKNRLVVKAESGPPSISESFRDRLQLDDLHRNGSLTITNITDEDFGHFLLQVLNSKRNRFRRFSVIEVEKVPVKVGESVTLKSDIEIQEGDCILWTFGNKNIVKAELGTTSIDESFGGRLQLNDLHRNGSLTIKNITDADFGHFKLQVINGKWNRFRRFDVIERNKVKESTEVKPLLSQVGEQPGTSSV